LNEFGRLLYASSQMKDDIKTVRKLCRLFKLTREQEFEFCDYLHRLKESGCFGTKERGDFTYKELEACLREFLGTNNGN